MPTAGGKPKVGEYLVWPDGSRKKVLERSGGDLWGVKVEDNSDMRGWRWIIPAQYYIDYLQLKIEAQ